MPQIKDLVHATELTSPDPVWIDGPVWKEKGTTTSISKMENDELLVAQAKVYNWLGKHGLFLLKAQTDLQITHDRMNAAKEAGDDEDYYAGLAYASRIAEAIIERQRKVSSLRAVLFNLDTEQDERGLRTFQNVVTTSVLITDHPAYQTAE